MASVEFTSTPAGAASFPVAVPPVEDASAAGNGKGMLRADSGGVCRDRSASAGRTNPTPRPLHRIREVREQQGLTVRTVARHMGVPARQVRAEEEPTSDLQLSDLYRWQQVLEVPIEDLLCEPEDPLSRPVKERAQLVRLMKTAAAILENAPTARMGRLAETLVGQLVEIMPELREIHAWHAVGQRRSLDELGRTAERPISEDTFRS